MKKLLLYLFFWPYILVWKLLRRTFKSTQSHKDGTPALIQRDEAESKDVATQSSGISDVDIVIPEHTKSLLWFTDENPSKIERMGSVTITATLTEEGVDFKERENGFYSEPSLIWTQLPIRKNEELYDRAMYWPAYSAFQPEMRYQYLSWLQDITQPTNLSYVFLYYYGLERHLLIGNYDDAVDEIAILLKSHNKKSFREYATRALIVASISKNRLDVVERIPSILEEEIDEALALRIHKGLSMTPEDIVDVASRVGFTNKRYIKLYPKRFHDALSQQIKEYERLNGPLLSHFDFNNFKKRKSVVFANLSIPERFSMIPVPQVVDNKDFRLLMNMMLNGAHNAVKNDLHPARP